MRADKKAENARMGLIGWIGRNGSSNGREEESEPSGRQSESEDLNYRVRCEYCGNALRRLARQGFLQTKIYSRFGYYPWECPLCREPMMVKQQHRYKAIEREAVAGGMVASGNGAAGLEAVRTQSGDDSTPMGAFAELKPAESTASVMVESTPIVQFAPKPAESEPAIMAERETNPSEFQLTAKDAADQKPAKSKASRAGAAGSNGSKPRSRKAVSGTAEEAESDQKTA